MLNLLRFLAAHGIDPEVPLVLGGMVMGACIVVVYCEIREKVKELFNWKKVAINELNHYEARKQSLRNLRERIQMIDTQICSLGSIRLGETVSKSPDNSNDALLTKLVEKEQLQKQYETTKKQVELVDSCLEALSESQRLILNRFYIHRTYDYMEELMEKLGAERTMIYRKKDEALHRFTEIMYGVQPRL